MPTGSKTHASHPPNPPHHHAMSEEGTRRREVTTNAHCIGKRSMNFYLSPDLALKRSADLLVLAIFIESKPLQPVKNKIL